MLLYIFLVFDCKITHYSLKNSLLIEKYIAKRIKILLYYVQKTIPGLINNPGIIKLNN